MNFIVVLFLFVASNGVGTCNDRYLRVLSLLPYPDSNGTYGWDRGLELLPAARLAVKHINNCSDILPGYTIKLIERASDACGRSVITKGLRNLVGSALRPLGDRDTNHIVAIVGLACSTVTATVSPIASAFDLLQVSMANSQSLRNKNRFPHLWRVISASDVMVDATIMLMENFGWQRVGLISDGDGFFFQALAESFRIATRQKNYTLVVDEAISSSSSIIEPAIRRIQTEGVRIIFSPTTIPESVTIMCLAAKMNLVWPGYVWIFPSRSYEEFFSNNFDECDLSLFIKALENVILVDLEISGRDNSTTLVSGMTYQQYRAQYEVEYRTVQNEYSAANAVFSSTYNVYANAMYDEIWVLALAINHSLQELKINNFHLDEYGYNMPEITKIIEQNLKNVNFSGASTDIHFNDFNEVPTSVKILQVRNRVSVQLGQYANETLVILNGIDENEIPGDDFIRRRVYLNYVVAIELYVNAGILLIFASALLIVTLVLRKEPEILAISPLLSILIYVGCYQLICASVFTITPNFFDIPEEFLIVICYLEQWSVRSGINVITATILIRLIRIYRVFTHFGKTSKFWQDKYLFFVIVLISCVPDLITIVGIFVDPLSVMVSEEYLYDENPPVIEIRPKCMSAHNFSEFSYVIDHVYTALLIILLLAFAILTRKVNRKNFKDTKKITAFVSLFTIVTTMSSVISHFFDSTNRENAAIILSSYSYQVMVVLCLVILIAPKALPALYYRIYKKKRSFHMQIADKDMTISKVLIISLHNMKSKQNLSSSPSSENSGHNMRNPT